MNNNPVPIMIIVKKEESKVDKIANKLALIRNIIITAGIINYFVDEVQKGKFKKLFTFKKVKTEQVKTEE